MPCEFSLAHYRDTLNMDPHLFGRAKDRPKIILAHDVDLFPPYALQMAKVEHSLGVRATYFILQHSEFYNAMSPENMAIWKEIRGMGHEIGLHYNGEYSPDLSIAHFAFAYCPHFWRDAFTAWIQYRRQYFSRNPHFLFIHPFHAGFCYCVRSK